MKFYRLTALILALVFICSAFFSCEILFKNDEQDSTSDYYDNDTVYAQALALGYKGTLEEFIELISGKDGKDGAGIKSSLVDQNGHLIFVLTDGTLIDAGAITTSSGSFLVTFDYGDGFAETVRSENYKVERPEDPTREGYTFLFWYVESQLSDEYSEILPWFFDAFAITKDITLHAYWEPDYPTSDPVYPTDEAVVYDGSAVTITFYHTMGTALRDVLDKYIVEFNKMYPNITVEHTQVGGYDDVRDQIKQQLTANNQPNVAYCYPDHVALYNLTKKVVPLNNYITSDAVVNYSTGEILGLTDQQINNYVDGFFAEGAVYDEAGTMYTLPMVKSTEVLYNNKTFFEEYNLTVPTTWDELEEVSAKIKAIIAANPDKYNAHSYPFGYDSESNWFITMCKQYNSAYTSTTGTKFLFNNQTNRDFVKELRTWYDLGYFTTQELYGAYTSGLFTNTDSFSPSCFMCIASSAGANYQFPSTVNGKAPFEVGIAPLPQVNKNDPATISQGPSLCIFDQDNKQEVAASWLFVKFLTTNLEFQAAFSMTSGYMPAIELGAFETAAADSNAIRNYVTWLNGDAPAARALKVAFEQADAYFIPPAFNGSSKARDQVGELMKACLTTQTTDIDAMIKERFEEAVAECIADA